MAKTFDSKTFKKTFDAYVLRWHISVAILWILAFSPFLAYGIAKCLELVKIDITPLLPVLGDITFGAIASGIVSFGAVSFGVVAIGAVSVGVVAIGSVSCGIIAIGAISAGGLAFGNAAATGLITISTGSTGITPRVGGYAVGLIAIGRQASGLYTLSDGRQGSGVYQFSLERQDIRAVALFTRYLRQFKSVYAQFS